jgi:hypothetical protein
MFRIFVPERLENDVTAGFPKLEKLVQQRIRLVGPDVLLQLPAMSDEFGLTVRFASHARDEGDGGHGSLLKWASQQRRWLT